MRAGKGNAIETAAVEFLQDLRPLRRGAMNRNHVLKIIAEHREKLATEFGVKSLALFGSVVRDEATQDSDVDLLVEFDGRPVGLFHLSRTQHYLESILGVSKVDLVLRDGIKPALKERILREAIRAA